MVGQADECPDATDVAWIRRVEPLEGDANRSRWPTDPTWKLVQGATFADAPAEARRLIRRKVRSGNIKKLDEVDLGCLVSRVAHLHPDGGAWTLSRAVGEALPTWEKMVEQKMAETGQDFGEMVRERRRERMLPLPPAEKVLPFRPRQIEPASAPALDAEPYEGATALAQAEWRARLVEQRLQDLSILYEASVNQGQPSYQLARLRATMEQETDAYAAAVAQVGVIEEQVQSGAETC